MANILLIHGGWHAAWCWYKVMPRLVAAGHSVIAMDLPGHGRRATDADPSLQDYVDCAVEALRQFGAPAVVIGHSMGGVVLQRVCEVAPEAVSEAVYLTAIVCPTGQTIAAESALDSNSQAAPYFQRSPGGKTVTISREGQRKAFFHDCSEDDMQLAELCLTPQPIRPLVEPVILTDARFGVAPRTYIECLDDVASTLEHQRRCQANFPPQRVLQLNSSHSPFLSQPDSLTALIDLIAREPLQIR